MGNRKIYLVLIIAGATAAICGILMKFSHDPGLHNMGLYLGWSGIAIVLIARLFFGKLRG